MRFFEALKLRNKLFYLFVFITLGLIGVGIVGASYVNAMKKNSDALYFGSFIPTNELHDLLHLYDAGIARAYYMLLADEISVQDASLQIKSSLRKIRNKWRSYTSHYKSDEELAYIDYVSAEMQDSNRYFENMQYATIRGVEGRIEALHVMLRKLIKYEVDVTKYDRKVFLNHYENILQNIGTVLVLIIIAVLAFSMYVFRSIQEDNTKLQQYAQKLKSANKKLQNASYTDSLTNLYNRRYFNHIYEKELSRAKREHTYITFMMLDIDYFKQYNDTYGHVEGDFALKSVAKVLKDTLRRPSDYVFRLGGEEFGVLLSGTNESDSATLARKINEVVRKRQIKHEGSQVHEYLTISIGVVCCVADEALDDEVLITKADEMLYKAKENGRDRYQITTNVSNTKTVNA